MTHTSLSNTISFVSELEVMKTSEELIDFCEKIEKEMLRGVGVRLQEAYQISREDVSQTLFNARSTKKQIDAKMKIFERAKENWVKHIEKVFVILRKQGFSEENLWDWSAGYCYQGEKE